MNIILIVYKIEKDKGSEDGTGYHLAKHLIQKGDHVTLISRINNIEKLKNDPAFNGVNLIGIDVPKPFSYIKKKGRGIILYYYFWQYCVGRLVNDLQSTNNIDVIHQLNFHGDWAPHFIKKKNAKIIYGPIVHHDVVPVDFVFGNKFFNTTKEWFKKIAKQYFWYLDPFVKKTARNTDIIFYGNENLAPPYQAHKNKIQCLAYGGSVFKPSREKDISHPFQVLFVGRFVNLKGCVPAMDAFAQFLKKTKSDSVMHFVGEGPLEGELKRRADFHDIAPYVKFTPWMEQKDLIKHYQTAHTFLYPSFESQGLVVTEALSSGCPVICLESTGPAYLAGDSGGVAPQGDYQKTVDYLAQQLKIVYTAFSQQKPYQTLVNKAVDRYETALTWDIIANQLRASYRDS